MFVAPYAIRRPRARSSAGTLPGDLEPKIARFVEHHNHRRYHESLQNPTADVYFGRAQTILLQRERIKRDTIRRRVSAQTGPTFVRAEGWAHQL
jgi:hypothetical protein